MNELEEKLGPGYQQMIIGMLLFIAGALWGGMAAGDDMKAVDVYWPAVVMLSGAMITLLRTTFGTDNEEDRANDLNDAIAELTGMLNNLQDKVSGGGGSAEEEKLQ